MKNRFRPLIVFATFCFLPALNVSAATISNLITSGSTEDLVSFELDGVVVDQSSLIGVTMTETGGKDLIFGTGTSSSNRRAFMILENNGSVPAGANRTNLIDVDNSLATGYAGVVQMQAVFDTAIPNQTGAEIFLFDIGGPDDFSVTINGQTVNYLTTDWNDDLKTGVNLDLWATPALATNQPPLPPDPGNMITSIADLETANFASKTNDLNTDLNGIALDLSDFGVADGASITTILLESGSLSAGGPLDVTYIGAIPETSTYALLGGMCVLSFVMVRRIRISK